MGENWQDDYYIWDCAAGTGNLLAGLTNKYNIYASTLDQADINVMHERIDHGANLLKNHVFQFDFLNDDFSKLPLSLQDIINDEAKRKKLVVYINPPYAEHGNISTKIELGSAKSGVAKSNKTYDYFSKIVGTSARELFTQFFLRIHKDIPDVTLASFSKLKHINSQNFSKFRQVFEAKYNKGFIVPADTFDNVKGKFPIGFLLWDLSIKEKIEQVETDVFQKNGDFISTKTFYALNNNEFISSWLRKFYDKKNQNIGFIILPGVDMQAQNGVYITSIPTNSDLIQHKTAQITEANLSVMCIYLTVRHIFEQTWINDRDQFLHPNDGWQTDLEFQNDCLAFALFHGQNRITSSEGINHWIPFTEQEVNAQEKFASHFMTDFIKGKISPTPALLEGEGEQQALFETVEKTPPSGAVALLFSSEATAVFDAGRALWKYYHNSLPFGEGQGGAVNASLYDIRAYFQGRNATGRMNTKSNDAQYMTLIGDLRKSLIVLADKIKPKVYEYGFLKE